METRVYKRLSRAVKKWWLHLLLGILFVALGFWVFATPFTGFVGLAILFATVMLVSGFFEVFFALINRRRIENWGWYFAGAMVDFIIGVILVFYPHVTLKVLPIFLGIWLLARGFTAVGISLDLRQYKVGVWFWLMLTGIATIIFALLIFANPLIGGITIGYMTALAFITTGFFRIVLAIKLRRLHQVLEERFPEGLQAAH
jgi:uncharacterized membrane protein HdeD (DUF308 family)